MPRHDLILAGVVKAHVNDKNPRLEVNVFVNGRQVARWVFRDGGLRHTDVRIPATGLRDYLIRPLIRLTFEIKKPVSPAELGLSGDQRSLGLGVREFTVREF
jgi:hypothetical protein